MLFTLNEREKNMRSSYIKLLKKRGVQSSSLQWSAIKLDPRLINDLRRPTQDMVKYCVEQCGRGFHLLKEKDEKISEIAIKHNPYNIQELKNPSKKIVDLTLSLNGLALEYIKKSSEDQKIIAIKQNGIALKYISNPTDEMKLISVKSNGMAIQFIINPSEELQNEAISQNIHALEFIENQKEEFCWIAVKQQKDRLVQNLSLDMCRLLIRKTEKNKRREKMVEIYLSNKCLDIYNFIQKNTEIYSYLRSGNATDLWKLQSFDNDNLKMASLLWLIDEDFFRKIGRLIKSDVESYIEKLKKIDLKTKISLLK